MQNGPHSFDEQLQCLTKRILSNEPLGYIYNDEIYLLNTIKVSDTNVTIVMFNGEGQILQTIRKDNEAEIQDFVALVKLLNDV